MNKLILTVTTVKESVKEKGTVTISAKQNPNALNFFDELHIKVKKGELEVGDKIQVEVTKVKK